MTQPVLSSSNRTQARYMLEGKYPLNFGVPQAGNGVNLNMTGETFNYDIKNEQSKVLRSDRLVAGHVQVSASAGGGLNVEHQYAEYDMFMQSVVGRKYTVYGTNGVGTAVATLTVTSATVLTAGAAPTGTSDFTGLEKGQWFVIIPDVAASQAIKDYLKGRAFKLSSTVAPTTTVLTLDAATPLNTALLGASLSNAKIASSRTFNGPDMWSWTMEIAHEDISRFRVYTGQIPSKFMFKLAIGQIVTGSFEFVGKSMVNPLPTATTMGTPVAVQPYTSANATRGVFDIFEGGTSVTATTYIKSGEFTIDGGIRVQEAVGVFGAAGIAPGTIKVTGSLEVYFADSTVYNKFLSGTQTSLALPILDVDGNGYVYVFPAIKYTAAKVNASGQDQDNGLTMSFEADYDSNSSSPTYNRELTIYRVGVATTPAFDLS